MSIDEGQVTKNKGVSKGLIISIIVAILVIGGGVAAYVSMNNPSSPKGKFLLAEKDSMEFISETVEKRFESELDWSTQAEEKPTETSFELSAEYNDPNAGMGYGAMNPAEFINNSVLTIKTQSDLKDNKVTAEFAADVAGFTVDDIQVALTEEEFTLGLPFLDDLLQIKSSDASKLLHEVMPELVSADEEIDFAEFFEATKGYLSEKDIKNLKKKYIEDTFKDLPEDAFTASEEKIDVHSNSMKTDKITLDLNEEQVKDLLTTLFDKLQKDDIIKDMIKDQFANQMFGLTNAELMLDNGDYDLINDFEDAMSEAKEEIKDLHIPDGFKSTIWINDKLIVKRDLSMKIGPNENELVTLAVNGTQHLTDTNQLFSYDIGFEDSYNEGTLTITGDFSWEDDQIKDSIKLLVEDIEIAYEAEETLKKGEREFDRTFSLLDEFGDGGKLLWTGTSSYEKDQMNSSHSFALDIDDFGPDIFSLHATIDGKQIKEVKIPEGSVKDLGNMTIEEIEAYIEEDAAAQFQQWLMKMMGSAGGLGF